MPEIWESDLGKWWMQRIWWIMRQDIFERTKVVCVSNEQGWGKGKERKQKENQLTEH